MTEKNRSNQRIRLIYGIIVSVLTVIVGVCLIASCIAIYKTGDAPFTRESIAQEFAKIAIPVYAYLVAVLLWIPLSFVFPDGEARVRGTVDEKITAERLRARVSDHEASLSPEQRKAMRREFRIRIVIRAICALICVLSALPLVFYLCDLSHFTPALNDSVLAATYMSLPLVILGGAACFLEGILEHASFKREVAFLKELIATEKIGAGVSTGADAECRSARIADNVVRVIVLIVAVAFICMGIFNGGMKDVLGKAIKICTECIGLG